jgi:DNA-binding beta-propeller fold protein YncE
MVAYRLLGALFVLALSVSAPSFAKELVYIEARQSKDIHIFDATTFQSLGKIDVGFPVDDVVGSHDGKMVFGNASIPNGNPVGFPDEGVVYAISTATNKILWWCSIPGTPQHLAVSPDNKKLYVPSLNMNHIYIVDTATGRIIETWPTIFGNHGSELSEDGKRLYTGNILLNRIDIYDTGTGQLIKIIRTRDGVRPFKFDKDEKLIYYQLSNLHGFEIRDIQSGNLVKAIDLPKLPADAEADVNGTLNHGISITPDGKKLLAAGSVANYVAVYSMPDLKYLGKIAVGKDPNWIRVRADSKVAFTGNRGSNDMSVIDIDQMKELARLPAGTRPERLAIVDVK